MPNAPHKTTLAQSLKMSLGFDPVAEVQAARAAGLVSGGDAYALARVPKPRQSKPKEIEVVVEIKPDAKPVSAADRELARCRLRLANEMLLSASVANPNLLNDPAWKEARRKIQQAQAS